MLKTINLLILIALSNPVFGINKVIFGGVSYEDREMSESRFKHIFSNTGIMVSEGALDEPILLRNKIMSVFYNNSSTRKVCEDIPFLDEVAVGTCSGVLVGEDLVATAGHCIDLSIYKNTWYFNYQNGDDLTKREGYKVTEILHHEFENISLKYSQQRRDLNTQRISMGVRPLPADIKDFSTYKDIALLRLDRPVTGFRKIDINFEPMLKGQRAISVGHPLGLPMKHNDRGQVVGKYNSIYMTSTIDTLKGNSGGPLFDYRTGELVGITVNQGFKPAFGLDRKKRCYRFNKYDESESQTSYLSGHMLLSPLKIFLNESP